MSDLNSRLNKLPITNVDAWNQIVTIISDATYGGFQPRGKSVGVSYYNPAVGGWEHADINESKQRAIYNILHVHPLGADHFKQWLETGSVKLNSFNHPSDPGFIAEYLEIHWLCEIFQVSHTLNYNEGAHTWDYTIHSASKVEEFNGKSYSLSTAMECVLEHLFKVGKDYLLKLRVMDTPLPEGPVEHHRFAMAILSGRVSLKEAEPARYRVKSVSKVEFFHDLARQKPFPVTLSQPVEGETDIRYTLRLDGEVVGMLLFDFKLMVIEWEVSSKLARCTVQYTTVLERR